MKEAFDIMGSHPGLTLFLGALFILSLEIVGDVLKTLINKIPKRKTKKESANQ
jgi:hypothetical protein